MAVNDALFKQIYDFASSAGALEGFVYQRPGTKVDELGDWIGNLTTQYHGLPGEVINAFKADMSRTMGRAYLSLKRENSEDHTLMVQLRSIIPGELPKSPDDFGQEKQEKKDLS